MASKTPRIVTVTRLERPVGDAAGLKPGRMYQPSSKPDNSRTAHSKAAGISQPEWRCISSFWPVLPIGSPPFPPYHPWGGSWDEDPLQRLFPARRDRQTPAGGAGYL